MENKKISSAVIRRMPRYYRYLGELLDEGVERISSLELSNRMNISASQIRQDLNYFGGFGQQGYGYNVKHLRTEIGKILGLYRKQNIVILGAGNLGQAIANYPSFVKHGFEVKALFDINPSLKGKQIRGARIYSMDELPAFLKCNKIDIGVLTLPKTKAAEAAKILEQCGIKAIWNFAHTDLQVSKNIIVENVHLSESLMRLSYRTNESKTKES